MGEPETTPLTFLLPCCAAISLQVLLCAAVSVAVKKAHLGCFLQAAQQAETLCVVVVESGGPKETPLFF